MKTLLKSIVVLSLFCAHHAFALGGCFGLWYPSPGFFNAGGSVLVIHPDGSGYGVSKPGPYETGDLMAGDAIYVFPPDCNTWAWGIAQLFSCNSEGGVDAGPPQLESVSSVIWQQFNCVITCWCPWGSSSMSIVPIKADWCLSQPPPPQ